MPSDYEQIRAANITEYGKGTRHLALLGNIYSKRTHFIFELLQNAEDAKATRLEFRLWPDRLEVLHDGRVFDERDVCGICGVGKSTNQGDLTRIGRFGIGFKSVHAVTDQPEVHSGDESFRIEHYVRPYKVEARILDLNFTTLFLLPFGGGGVSAPEAFAKIGMALRELNPTTLLFLRRIELVIIEIQGHKVGRFMREVEDEPSPHVRRVRLEASSAKGGEEDWLVFDRPVVLKNERNEDVELRVEAAFRLQGESNGARQRIVAIGQSPLVAFFPTEKKTELGFLIQGPYHTTHARDNVPEEDSANTKLVQETGELVVDALLWLKTNDSLTVDVLKCLPINQTQFSPGSMFRPIYETVRAALLKHELLPVFSEKSAQAGFAAGAAVKAAGSGDLRNLVSRTQLASLIGTDEPLFWLSPEITADRTPVLWEYLRHELGVEEIDAEGFVRRMTEEFLASQPDSWIAELYVFLAGQRAWLTALRYGNRQGVPFVTKPIIRLEDGRHVPPLKDDGSASVFLPSDGPTSFDCVKRTVVAKKEAREFLASLGFAVPDECDAVLHNLLPRYAEGKLPAPEDYRGDLARIFAALKTDSASKRKILSDKLKALRFVCANNAATGQVAAKTPMDVYFRSAELELYFQGNPEGWFLDSELEAHREALHGLGVAETVRVKVVEPRWDGYVVIRNWHGDHKRGLNRFDPECEIDGLQHALEHPNTARSALVWNSVLGPSANLISGCIESSSRQDFSYSRKSEEFSAMGRITTESGWLPDTTGKLHKPGELSLENLPSSFDRDETLARQLRMKFPPPPTPPSALAQLAQSVGVSLADIEYLKQNKGEFDEFKQWQVEQKRKPNRPQNEPHDAMRRAERVTGKAKNASPVDRQPRERQVRVNWTTKEEAKTTLRELNTNGEGQMVCQVCGDEMPFKLEDESYYFEAVECVKGLNLELPQNYIALCPVCAAKFRYANGTPASELKQRILSASGSEVTVTLAREERGIVFTEVHLLDLQAALKTL